MVESNAAGRTVGAAPETGVVHVGWILSVSKKLSLNHTAEKRNLRTKGLFRFFPNDIYFFGLAKT